MPRALLSLGLAAASLLPCAPRALAQAPDPPAARWVEEAFQSDPGPLDFVRGDGEEQFIAQALTGDALVGLSPEGRPVPRLAASWREVNGGLDLVLRADARFADGSPVSAADVAWTFRAIEGDPQASATKRAALGDTAARGEGLRVELRGSRPPERLLRELWRVPIAKAGQPGMGSGPFLLQRDGAAWTFTARPGHFLHPALPGLRFRLLPDEAARLVALQKGWLTLGAPPPRPGLAPPPGMVPLVQPTLAQVLLFAGPGAGPGALPAFARWRRDAFPPRLLGELYSPAAGLWPAALGFRAREPDATGAPCPRVLELAYTAGDGALERALQALAARAARDGVTLRLRPLEAGLFLEKLLKGQLALGAITNVFDPHPWSVLGFVERNGDLNVTGWRDPAAEALLPRLADPASPAWDTLQALWARHPAALPILDVHSHLWIDRRLQVQPSALGLYLPTPGAAGWRWRE
ncbi:MAG TPA: ABC transporter substrate-binding protein [Holophagaceae bacterium]|nr:ABC transporter substrate-binding protein [Holophagaceae bacterium]